MVYSPTFTIKIQPNVGKHTIIAWIVWEQNLSSYTAAILPKHLSGAFCIDADHAIVASKDFKGGKLVRLGSLTTRCGNRGVFFWGGRLGLWEFFVVKSDDTSLVK